MQLQKEVKSYPAVKKVCGPIVEKDVNPKWQPRNGCDGRLMATMTIQVPSGTCTFI